MKKFLVFALAKLNRLYPQFFIAVSRRLMRFKFYAQIQSLKKRGYKIDVIYDIGARHGEWSSQFMFAFPNSKIFMFEANSSCEKELKKTGYPYYINVLSCEDGESRTFFTNDSTGDSLFKENSEIYDDATAVEVTTSTLYKVVQDNKIPAPDFIKIDTQGSELEILSGADSLLSSVNAVYLEAPLVEYNKGAPNIYEYISFMKGHQFFLLDVCELHYGSNGIIQMDLLFVRDLVDNSVLKKLN
jgi:FkbM family methyltransferase